MRRFYVMKGDAEPREWGVEFLDGTTVVQADNGTLLVFPRFSLAEATIKAGGGKVAWVDIRG